MHRMVSNSRTRQSELLLHLVASVKTLGKSENGEAILPKGQDLPSETRKEQGKVRRVLEKALAFLHNLITELVPT